MKPRKVIITLRAWSRLSIKVLRGAWRYDVFADGGKAPPNDFKVTQVNVVREPKVKTKKGVKR